VPRSKPALEVAELLSSAGYETTVDGTTLRVTGAPFTVSLEVSGKYPPGATILKAYADAIEKTLEEDRGRAPVGLYSGLFGGMREVLVVTPLWFLLQTLKR